MANNKVFLSAGHGGSDPGAMGYGLVEKNINLVIMTACKEVLERNGVTVICSRIKDENDPVGQEVQEANRSGADVAVSFHTNAGGGDGSESYYYYGDEKGKRLAGLCEKYTQGLGQNTRGVKKGNGLYFISQTKMTAVLCECAFIDNDRDNDIIDTRAEQEAFGVAYAKAILEFLGIQFSEAPAPSKPADNNGGEFLIKIEISDLNIRKGPGTNYPRVGQYIPKGVYTIVDVANGPGSSAGWGLLKSYKAGRDGWISLDFVKRV